MNNLSFAISEYEPPIPRQITSLKSLNISSSNITTNSITTNITIFDNASGLSSIKWYYKKESDSSYILTNDENDIYVEPKFKVTFNVNIGGSLEGEKVQEVYNFEELEIPKVVTEEGYEFIKWEPEIPTEGKLEKNVIFNGNTHDFFENFAKIRTA